MKTISISDPKIADELRKKMAIATENEKGLLSNAMFLMLSNGHVNAVDLRLNADVNELYLECDVGLTLYVITASVINSPGAGMLLHFQRLPKGNATSSSFLVSQIAMLTTGSLKHRFGYSNGKDVVYSQWRTI